MGVIHSHQLIQLANSYGSSERRFSEDNQDYGIEEALIALEDGESLGKVFPLETALVPTFKRQPENRLCIAVHLGLWDNGG